MRAVTLTPGGGWSNLAVTADPAHAIAAHLRPASSDFSAWSKTTEGMLNVALYVPLGLALALLLRRPLAAALAATMLSFAIECYQATLTSRVGCFADVVANGLGAALGAGAAGVFLLGTRLAHRHAPLPRPNGPGVRAR